MADLILPDVSHYNGFVAWEHVGPAAICKATEGAAYVDGRFQRNADGMRRYCVLRGFYHFLTTADLDAQADNFAKAVGRLRPGEFAVLDVEGDREFARHELLASKIDQRVGGQCWLYGGQQVSTSRPAWIARYADHTPNPANEPTAGHVLWQYTDRGTWPGIAGRCDLSVHRGDLASLARYALPEEDDMTPDECRAVIREELAKVFTGAGQTSAAATFERLYQDNLAQTKDIAAIRAALAQGSGSGGATAGQVADELARRLTS